MAPKSTPAEPRFWAKVEKHRGDRCWLWTGAKGTKGYGHFVPVWKQRGKYAHRYAYELLVGPIPDGLLVLHRCDNPSCVRPDHLFLGTHHENHVDMVNKDRHTRGSRNKQAKLTEDQVREIVALLQVKTQTEIAQMYDISQSSVSSIKLGKSWTHV